MDLLIPYMTRILLCAGAIAAAVFLGNGAVYFFNKMPAQWFCEYGESPSPEMLDPHNQRISGYPWKTIFTMLFVVIGIWMVMDDVRFAVAAECTIWILIEIAIGDALYQIIADQLVILLAVSAVGYIPYYESWKTCVFGAAAGFGILGAVALAGWAIHHRESVGQGDIKLFTALGFLTGPVGIVVIFTVSTLLLAVRSLIRRMQGISSEKPMPMAPYVTPAAILYLVFLWGRLEMIVL